VRLLLTNIFRKSIGLFFNVLVYVFPAKIGQWAFDVFAKPREGKVSPDQAKFLETATTHHFRLDHTKYTIGAVPFQVYEWKNSGPTLLLVHGWESNSARWELLIKQLLATGYQIIALDAPGHGNTGAKEFNIPMHAEMMAQVFDKWTIEGIIAHSLGASTTCYFIDKYQASLKGCVLLAPPKNLQSTTNLYYDYLALSKRSKDALHKHFQKRIGQEIKDFEYTKFVQNFDFPGLIMRIGNSQSLRSMKIWVIAYKMKRFMSVFWTG